MKTRIQVKRFCTVCKENELCVVIAHDEAGNANVAICHRCGDRVS